MDFLNVEYLQNLENKLSGETNILLESIGGGSTLSFIALGLFAFCLLITSLTDTDFTGFMYLIKRRISVEKNHAAKLKNYKKNFDNEKLVSLSKDNLNKNTEYNVLLNNYKDSKVGFIEKSMYYILLPLFYIVNCNDDSDETPAVILFVLSVLLIISGTVVGFFNAMKEETAFSNATEDIFIAEGKPIQYPVIYYKKEGNSYELFYLSGNNVRSIDYEGVIHMDSNLNVDNSVLKDKVLVVDSKLEIDSNILAQKNIVGYLEIDTYTPYINEYNKFKKENKDFLENSAFYDLLEDLEYSLKGDFEVSSVILKGN